MQGLDNRNVHDVYLPITSQVYSFNRKQGGMVISEMYQIDKGLAMRNNYIGSWNGTNLTWDNSSLFERRKDLSGYKFEAVTLPDPPIITVE